MTKSKLAKRLRSNLKKLHKQAHKRFSQKHPLAIELFIQKGLEPHKLRKHATQILASATMASTLLTQPAVMAAIPGKSILDQAAHTILPSKIAAVKKSQQQKDLIKQIKSVLPAKRGQLNPWELGGIAQALKTAFNIDAKSELEGRHLNYQYGLIGFEQHLKRFPGDTLSQHDEVQEAGIAPGLGAWGYFVDSKSDLTQEDELREKYYVAVQTLYLPEWNEAQPEIKEWYKYRKVVVVNPENGQSVVADIADAGPARFTGKVFGGSPEVMEHLDLHLGVRKGKVVLLFLDDPNDKVPLGPLEYNKV